MGALKPHKIPGPDLKAVQSIFDRVESRPERYELNLYVSGIDEAEAPEVVTAGIATGVEPAEAAPAGESGAASSPPPEDPAPPTPPAATGESGDLLVGDEDASTTEESES